MIEDREISFVVQGPIVDVKTPGASSTVEVVQSVRRQFPHSRIILSSWKGTSTENLNVDAAVLSEDPGALYQGFSLNNVNRQIVSTSAGLNLVETQFSVKLRTDSLIRSRKFLDYFGRMPNRRKEFKVFDEKIVVGNRFCRNPALYPLPFHPSDIFQFGLTSDLRRFWNIPLAPEPETSEWFKIHARPPKTLDYFFPHTLRYFPEQYLWITCLKQAGYEVGMDYGWQVDKHLCRSSELSIVNNFIIAKTERLGVELPKRLLQPRISVSIYSDLDFLIMYYRDFSCFPPVLGEAVFLVSTKLKRLAQRFYFLAKRIRDVLTRRRQ